MVKKLSNLISPEAYFNDLCLAFPELKEPIENEEGEHSKMERFADYTIKQIKTDNISELTRCFDYQEEKIPLCPALKTLWSFPTVKPCSWVM